MVKTGVVIEKWSGDIQSMTTSMTNIKKIEQLTYSFTDLNPFKELNTDIDSFNNLLAKMQTYAQADASKMLQAGDHKVSDDQQEAQHIQSGLR